MVDGVSSLVDKSLLRQEEGPGGRAALRDAGDHPRVRPREATGEREAEKIRPPPPKIFPPWPKRPNPSWWVRIRCRGWTAWRPNTTTPRAAPHGRSKPGTRGSAPRIGGALWRFWNVRGHFSEGRRWLTAGLSGEGAAPASLRARASLGLGYLDLRQGDYPRAVEDLEASHSLYQEIGDREGKGQCSLLSRMDSFGP